MARAEHKNVFGRKPGRGVRPLLLIPKVLCVGVYFGALAGIAVLWVHRQLGVSGGDGRWQVQAVSVLFRWLVIPSLVLTLLFGLLLFLQHARVFWAMRWVKLKLLMLATVLPALHLTMRPLLGRIKASYDTTEPTAHELAEVASACRWFSIEMAAAVLVTAGVIFLGRHKPRLGQNYARALPAESDAGRRRR